ncbi:putative ATP-dependent RNA helicase TDRD12 [Ornithodoros turicata]|uniref:putative ATP-dependent RNA helicase TDRD12 n=1 Tax=Ornithodoros turicata TaxID=34597 RepID=UPI0031395563
MEVYRTPKGWKERVDVTILKVIEPHRFLIKEAPSVHMSYCGQAFLELEGKLRQYMSKYDIQPLDTGPPEIGAEIVVRKSRASDWYRGKVKRILETLEGYKIEVYLIDYGDTFYVEHRLCNDNIRVAPPHVFDIPGQAVEFFLPYLKPAKLTLDTMAVAVHRPSTTWDTAALGYVKALVTKGGAAEVSVFGETKTGSLYGKLSIRSGATTLCIAQNLVEKMYAFLDKTSEVVEDLEARDSLISPCTPSIPIVPAVQVVLQKQKKHQQEEDMKTIIEQALHGTDSGCRATTPSFREPLPKKTTPDKPLLQPATAAGQAKTDAPLPPSSALPSTGRHTPLPSFSSEELLFSDIEMSTVAPTNQAPVLPGRGRALLLLSCGKRVGDGGATERTVPRPGEERTGIQVGDRGRLLDNFSLSGTHGSRRARSKSQLRLASVSSAQPGVEGGGVVSVTSSECSGIVQKVVRDGSPSLKLQDVGMGKDRRKTEESTRQEAPHQSASMPNLDKAHRGATKLASLLQKKRVSSSEEYFSSAVSSKVQSSLHLLGEQGDICRIRRASQTEVAQASESVEKLKKLLSKSNSETSVRTLSGCRRTSSASSMSSAAQPSSQTSSPAPQASRHLPFAQLESSLTREDPTSRVSATKCVRCPQFSPKMCAVPPVSASTESPEKDMTVAERLRMLVDNHRRSQVYGFTGSQALSVADGGGGGGKAAACNEEQKEGEVSEQDIFKDILKGFPVDDSSEEEDFEAKWELKFTSEGNDQELVDLNVCQDNDDFRCNNFNNFSDVPPDLEPYTQFQGEVNFSTCFEPSHWAARIESKLVRALMHGVAPPRPAFTLDQAHFPEPFIRHITSLGFKGPSCIQSVVWPAVLSGRSIVEVAAPHTGKTLSYLLPLLSRVISESDYEDLPDSSGPLVLVLSSTWKGAQRIYDELLLLVQDHRLSKCCVLYAGGSEAGKEVQLVNGCDILVATPLSFLRILRTFHGTITNLKRCCHLVLDDGERLIEEFTEEVGHILTEYSTCLQERASECPLNQIIVCSTRWTTGLRSLLYLLAEQQSPLVFFSSFFEAAVYSQVPTFAHYVDRQAKDKTLLDLVEGCRGKKTVICTHSHASALSVHKLLRSISIYSLLLHDKLVMSQIWDVENTWASPHTAHSVPFLVAMDNVLSWANVRDAAAVIHYDVPELSKFNFGFRFSCLVDRMQSFDKMNSEEANIRERPVSHLLLTAEDQALSVPLVEFLKRLNSKIPSELLMLADKELKRRMLDEDLPLCPKLKAFGRCEALEMGKLTLCRNRHNLTAALDSPSSFVPSRGEVKIFITKVVDVSHFYGLILEHCEPSEDGSTWKRVEHTQFFELAMEMGHHFSQPHHRIHLDNSESPVVGCLYALETQADHFQRVKVTPIKDREVVTGEPLRVEVFYVDHGHTATTAAHCLLHLPERFARDPPYAVEVYCCRIQPQDRDLDWTFQAEFAVHNLVNEKEVYGKVALCMGSTLWLDPLVIYKRLGNVRVTVIDTHVRNSLISTGMVCDNPKHLTRLREAAKTAGIPVPPLTARPKREEDDRIVEPPASAFLDLTVYNKVYMWKVHSPHRFYVQTEKFTSCLENLEKDISKHVAERKLQRPKALRQGLLCLAPFTNDCFYRGQVESISSHGVTVFFPDYGDTAECPQEKVYSAEPWMLLLPFQGIECKLAGVAPPEGEWQPEAADALEDMGFTVTNISKMLCAMVVNHARSSRPGVRCYEIILYDTAEGHDIDLGMELIRKGLALATEISVPDMNLSNTATMVPSPWMTAASASRRSCSSSDSDDFNLVDEDCAEALTRHMDSVYGEMRDAILKQHAAIPNSLDSAAARPPPQPQNNFKGKDWETLEAFAMRPPSLESCCMSLNSTQPNIKWWQDKEHVYMDILITRVKTFDFVVKSHRVRFRTEVNGCIYEVDEGLHANVVANACSAEARPDSVRVTLRKSNPDIEWQDLTNRGYRVRHVRYDLNHLVDSDEEARDKNRNPYPPGYVRSTKVLHYDPVAHEDDILETERRHEHIHAPLEDLYNDLDPHDLFT